MVWPVFFPINVFIALKGTHFLFDSVNQLVVDRIDRYDQRELLSVDGVSQLTFDHIDRYNRLRLFRARVDSVDQLSHCL